MWQADQTQDDGYNLQFHLGGEVIVEVELRGKEHFQFIVSLINHI